MRIVVLGLLLSVSFGVMAQVMPLTAESLPKAGIRQTNVSNLQIMRKEANKTDEELEKDTTARLERYQNILTQDNVQALANITRFMQDDPGKLVGYEYWDAAMGMEDDESGEVRESYNMPEMGDDPAKNFLNIPIPVMSQKIVDERPEDLNRHEEYIKVRKQIEQVARQHLGQKSAPIRLK